MESFNLRNSQSLYRILLFLIVLFGGYLRFTGLNWDGLRHFHPDERYISWVATTVDFPTDRGSAFDPLESSFNPYYWPPDADTEGIVVPQDEGRKYAYGHLPLYLGVLSTRLVEKVGPVFGPRLPVDRAFTHDFLNTAGRVEYHHLTVVSRALTALVDTGTILLAAALGTKLWSRGVGLMGAGLYAAAVMQIQTAHFFISDPYLTFFATAALLCMVMAEKSEWGGWRWLAAECIGLAMGSKVVAGLLFFPLLLSFWMDIDKPRRARLGKFALAAALALLTFALTNPFALLDHNCMILTAPRKVAGLFIIPTLEWHWCFLVNLIEQSMMAGGGAAFPFTRQYDGTLAYIYPLETLARWGLGPLAAIAGFAGAGWLVSLAVRKQKELEPALWLVLAWVVPYFLLIGSAHTKFMRYWGPLVPFLGVLAAALLWEIKPRVLRGAMAAVVLLPTTLYALAFVNMYQEPHPWLSAQAYLRAQGETVTVGEFWDDPILPGEVEEQINWLSLYPEGDSLIKLHRHLQILAGSDYFVVSSRRSYATLVRLPDTYPLSGQFHQLLFDGSLGFELVFLDGRAPQIAGVELWPQRFSPYGLRPPDEVGEMTGAGISFGPADESFLVYDQPLVMVFFNNARMSAEEMLALFEAELGEMAK